MEVFVQQHVLYYISPSQKRELNNLTSDSKLLYNVALHFIRPPYFHNEDINQAQRYLKAEKDNKPIELYGKLKGKSKEEILAISESAKIKIPSWHKAVKQLRAENNVCFRRFNSKVACHIVKSAFTDFSNYRKALSAYFIAIANWKKNPKQDKPVRPKPPNYKEKQSILIFDTQSFGTRGAKKGWYKLSGINVEFSTLIPKEKIKQITIVPYLNTYMLCIAYNSDFPIHSTLSGLQLDDNKPKIRAGGDLGLQNLLALTFDQPGLAPLIYEGGPLKSTNAYFNKKKAKIQAELARNLPKAERSKGINSKSLQKLHLDRKNKIKDLVHKFANQVVQDLLARNVSELHLGYNKEWKQSINLGKRNNQNFVYIPFMQIISCLQYKLKLVGISLILTEESYTSKCSFLDLESIEKHEEYKGRRVKRGLFKDSSGRTINADVNGSYNILRKGISNSGGAVWPTVAEIQVLTVVPEKKSIKGSSPKRKQKKEPEKRMSRRGKARSTSYRSKGYKFWQLNRCESLGCPPNNVQNCDIIDKTIENI